MDEKIELRVLLAIAIAAKVTPEALVKALNDKEAFLDFVRKASMIMVDDLKKNIEELSGIPSPFKVK